MRKLKVFGIAVVAGFALNGIAASAAFATYDSEIATTELEGNGTTVQVFNTKFGEWGCNDLRLTGVQIGTEKEPDVFASEEVTVHPEYSGCAALGFNATMTTAGCNYVFHNPNTEPPQLASVDLECEGTSKIHIVAAGGLCSIDIGPQEDVGNVGLTNLGAGANRKIEFDWLVDELEYDGVGGFCSGHGEGATQEGKVVEKGFVPGTATQVGIFVL